MKNLEITSGFNEIPEARVRLLFLRHAEKTGAGVVDAADRNIELTSEGVQQSLATGRKLGFDHPLVVSSDRERTKASALNILAGGHEERTGEKNISGDESFKELEEKVHKDLKIGSYLATDERLDFAYDKDSPERAGFQEAYDKGTFLQMLAEKHDTILKTQAVDNKSSYALQARNIALIIEEYMRRSPSYKAVLNEKKKHNNTIERILLSHGGVIDPFLAETIDKLKGREERNTFLRSFPNGFDFLKGFEVELVIPETGEIKIRVKASIPLSDGSMYTFNEVVPKKIIDEIIGDSK